MTRYLIRIPILVLCALLVLASCENSRPEIDITFESDARGVRDALTDLNQVLSARMSQLEAAMADGMADYEAALEQARRAVESLEGSLEEKIAAVMAVVKLQETGLEVKLALIEATTAAGFADEATQRALLQEAIVSLGGSMEEKIAAVMDVVKLEETGLEVKIELIEATMVAGFADGATQRALLQEAIVSLEGSLVEKLASLDTVMTNQATSLTTKIGLVESAVETGLADGQAAQALVLEAMTSLSGTLEEKLAAVQSALVSQQASLSSKLSLIETAMKEGFAGEATQQELIRQTLDSLGGSTEDRLEALTKAMESQLPSLETKLELIEESLAKGYTDDKTAIGLISTALSSLKGHVEGVDAQVDTVVAKLGTLDPATGSVSAALTSLLTTMDEVPNYSAILAAITEAVEKLEPEAPTLMLSSSCIEGDKIWIMSRGYIDIPFSVMSEGYYKIEITCPRDSGFTYSLYPNTTNPRRGEIRLTAGNIVNGEMTVQFTVTDGRRSSTQTFYYKELVLELAPNSSATRTVGYEGAALELLYRTNVPCTISVPDSVKSWISILSSGDKGEDKYINIRVARNYGKERKGSVIITELMTHNAHTLHFRIEQQGTDAIHFADPNLEAMLLSNYNVNLNKDTCITIAEIKDVQSLSAIFGNELRSKTYTSFDEFEYFTGIKELPQNAFCYWSDLLSITLPSTITTVADDVFCQCEKLQTIKGKFATSDKNALIVGGRFIRLRMQVGGTYAIPEGVTEICTDALGMCHISGVSFPSTLKYIRRDAFWRSDIVRVTIPAGVTVDRGSLDYCKSLKAIYGEGATPDSLALVKDGCLIAFARGAAITDYVIPEGVTDLDTKVFMETTLKKVTFPASLTHLGSYSFFESHSLQELIFVGMTPPSGVGEWTFKNTNLNCVIYVPKAALDAYKSAPGWSTYADRIVGYQ